MNPNGMVENLPIHPAKRHGKKGTLCQNKRTAYDRHLVLHRFPFPHLNLCPLRHGQNVLRCLLHSNGRHYDYSDYIFPSDHADRHPDQGRKAGCQGSYSGWPYSNQPAFDRNHKPGLHLLFGRYIHGFPDHLPGRHRDAYPALLH